MSYYFIDFEFTPSAARNHSLICAVSLYQGVVKRYTLTENHPDRDKLQADLLALPPQIALVAYAVDAEIRCLFSLFQTTQIRHFHYICLHREFKVISNRNPEMTHGEVVSKDSVQISKRKLIRSQKSENSEDRKYLNLLNALWKLCKIHEPQHIRAKQLMTDICARGDRTEIAQNLPAILEYCEMDVRHLPALLKNSGRYLVKYLRRNEPTVLADMLRRGRFAFAIAFKSHHGYYVDFRRLHNVVRHIPEILETIIIQIQLSWPQYHTFSYDKKESKYVFHSDEVRRYIKSEANAYVQSVFHKKTEKGLISLDNKCFEYLFPSRHNLPLDDYLAQIYRYKSTLSALGGLSFNAAPKGKRPRFGNFFDYPEGVVRPYFNDFGSQTGRNQPAANSYLLLKPAWLRTLVIPPPRHCMVVSDWSRQELLIGGILSNDKAILDDYASGDSYTAFGLRSGIIPRHEIPPERRKILRQACKVAVLGMQYGMGRHTLSRQISQAMGMHISPELAQIKYIDAFWRAYAGLRSYLDRFLAEYRRKGVAQLPSGWAMGPNNYNMRSVKNFPIQGHGGEAMRATVLELLDRRIWCPLTLHDATLCYVPLKDGLPDFDQVRTILQCMKSGFVAAMHGRTGSDLIQFDCEIVWPQYNEGLDLPKKIETPTTPLIDIAYAAKYIDPRAHTDLEIFSEYLT